MDKEDTYSSLLAAHILGCSGWSWLTEWPWYLDLAVIVWVLLLCGRFGKYVSEHP